MLRRCLQPLVFQTCCGLAPACQPCVLFHSPSCSCWHPCPLRSPTRPPRVSARSRCPSTLPAKRLRGEPPWRASPVSIPGCRQLSARRLPAVWHPRRCPGIVLGTASGSLSPPPCAGHPTLEITGKGPRKRERGTNAIWEDETSWQREGGTRGARGPQGPHRSWGSACRRFCKALACLLAAQSLLFLEAALSYLCKSNRGVLQEK